MMKNIFNRFASYLNVPPICDVSDEEMRKAGRLPVKIFSIAKDCHRRNNLVSLQRKVCAACNTEYSTTKD